MADILRSLQATREGYEEECVRHKFRIDAYTGGGGFAGAVKQGPSGFWGPAADIYSLTNVNSLRGGREPDSYIIKYPREDKPKYEARVQATTYDNYYGSIIDLKTSYVLREQFVHREVPDEVQEWLEDCDDVHSEWTEYRADIARRTAVVGWMGVLIDMEQADDSGGQMNRAQARELGRRPYPVIVYPANILDWSVDRSGQFEWVKIRTSSHERETWDADVEKVDSWTIWTRTDWVRYERKGHGEATIAGQGTHDLGIVPLALYRAKRCVDDPVRGNGLDDGVAEAARDYLNRKSEYIEHIRGQVFALLVYAAKGGQMPEDIAVGTDNALVVDSEGSQTHEYIAPPGTVASTFEGRLEAIVREMYRQARVEYARAGGGAQSGLSRAYEFAQTNLALADFAAEIARGDAWVMQIVARWYGIDSDVIQAMRVDAPKSFGVNDLAMDIKNAFDLIGGGVGPTASKMMKLALVKQTLPDLSADELDIIESELDDEAALDAAVDRFDDAGPLADLTVGSPESEADDDITTELEAGA